MSQYFLGSGISYQQYLQAKSFVSDLTASQRSGAKAIGLAVHKQTREVIASQEALARENIRAISASAAQVSSTIDAAFEQLSWELGGVHEALDQLGAKFQWGFSEVLASLGRMNDSLEDLVKIAKTPVQTIAYNHFEIARDAFRRFLFAESLEEISKAIQGDHTSPGYRLEWRFHMLEGTISLGSANGDVAHVDLAKAEDSFLLAARYSKADSPRDSARAFLAAGWAQYCQGKVQDALLQTDVALSLDPTLGEALFQKAKVLMALQQPKPGLNILAEAIEVDKAYALKAADDGDFQRFEADLRDFLEALRKAKAAEVKSVIEQAFKRLRLWIEHEPTVKQNVVVQRTRQLGDICKDLPLWDLFDAKEASQAITWLGEEIDTSAWRFPIEKPRPPFTEKPHFGEWDEQFLEPKFAFFSNDVTGMVQRVRRMSDPQTLPEPPAGRIIEFFASDGTLCSDSKLEFVGIPAGSFLMGWPPNEWSEQLLTRRMPEAEMRELHAMLGVQHRVALTRPFLMGITPMSVWDASAILGISYEDAGAQSYAKVNRFTGVCAYLCNYFKALEICNRLSELSGLEPAYEIEDETVRFTGLDSPGFRLPTEAEWEYACRAGTTGFYYGPPELVCGKHENSALGLGNPNGWGLRDLLGNNCGEWVFDYYAPYSATDVVDPVVREVGKSGGYRAARPTRGVAASRGKGDPGRATCGFRIARTLQNP